MTLSDISSIVGVISGLAVLGSLIYLAQQTRQNAKHTRALIQQSRSIQSADMLLRYSEDPSLNEILMRGDAGDATLDKAQIYRFSMVRTAAFLNWEDQFYQHSDGLLNDDKFAAFARTLRIQFRSPGIRHLWRVARSHFGNEFQAFLDDIIGQTGASTPPDLVDAWKAGIAAEFAEARA